MSDSSLPEPSLRPNMLAMFSVIHVRNPMHHRFVLGAASRLTPAEVERLDRYIDFCLSRGLSHEYLAASYLTVVNDTLREQAYFRKHKRYRYSTFAEVANSVYFDANYMSQYMYGLAISSFLWPNHLDIFRFFERTLPLDRPGRYLEIGPGHGYFLMTAMSASKYDEFTAVDISQTSIEQTRSIIEHFTPHLTSKADLQLMDFLDCDLPANGFDAVVMGEVLEHVEEPVAFLSQIHRVARPDAHIYVTTCLNAPAVDHISLFGTPGQLEELFSAAGLRIADQLIRPYEGKTVEESLSALLPVNVAYVLAKA